MVNLPVDIEKKIERDFADSHVRTRAKKLILEIWNDRLNVGPEQLARCILVLAEGNIEKLAEIKKDYWGDPRDVIMNAEAKSDFPGHYFSKPFEDEK